jgi:hypothetical protein
MPTTAMCGWLPPPRLHRCDHDGGVDAPSLLAPQSSGRPPGTVTAAQGEQPAASRRWHPQHMQQHWHADTAPASHARAAHAHIYDTTTEFTQHACKQALHVAGNKRSGAATRGENDESRRHDRRRRSPSPNYRQRLDCDSSAHKPTCGDARGGLRGTHARTRRCCAGVVQHGMVTVVGRLRGGSGCHRMVYTPHTPYHRRSKQAAATAAAAPVARADATRHRSSYAERRTSVSSPPEPSNPRFGCIVVCVDSMRVWVTPRWSHLLCRRYRR